MNIIFIEDLEYLGEKFTQGMAWIDLQILLSDGPMRLTIRELSERWKWPKSSTEDFIKKLVKSRLLGQTSDKLRTNLGQTLSLMSMSYKGTSDKLRTNFGQISDKTKNSPDSPSRMRAQVIDILEQDNNTLQEHNTQVQDNPSISLKHNPRVSKDTPPPSLNVPFLPADEKPPVIPPKKPAKKFVRPTVEEVRAYCEERSNGIDPEAFIDFYETNGWVQGKQGKPIKDWKACVRTWERMPIRSGRRTESKPTGSTMDQYTEFMKQIDEEYGLTNNLHSEVDEQ